MFLTCRVCGIGIYIEFSSLLKSKAFSLDEKTYSAALRFGIIVCVVTIGFSELRNLHTQLVWRHQEDFHRVLLYW